MKTFLTSIFWMLFLPLIVNGQINNEELVNYSNSFKSFDLRDKNLKGSTFINQELLPAKVSKTNKVYSMRYNAYDDAMEVEENGKLFYLKNQFNSAITFETLNKVYQLFSYTENNLKKSGYFVVLNSGDKITLLLKERIKFYDEVKPRTGYDKYQPPKLKREKDQFYFSYNNNMAIELPTKKKGFSSIFKNNQKAVESYISKNKLNIKKDKDIIQLFEYYNSLN
ncbi:hypothetical protein [Lutibacter sp. B1]|uniref:hypothetical protein n=1 Tax=Lutibacter sp. B1 TaxID=2725996 RepID=UPI0014572BE0|nr:hypothetical protein [Lutibacter sp. B1]NLP58487.1 hypothetical protein [Lutibacter sp. B1]